MRDGRRVRDRFEVSLEPRQVALLFVLVLVILVLVFALGIIVGRGLRSPVTPPAVAGAAPAEEGGDVADGPPVDAAALPGDPVEGEGDGAPKLKFYGADAKTPEREASAVAPTPADEPAAQADPAAAAPADAAPAPELKGLPAEPAPVKTAAVKADKASEKAKAKPEAKPKAEPKKAAKADAKPKAAGGKFTIQVSAFQSRSQADQLVSNLKNKGYDAYIAQAVIPGKGIWYRVRIGTFGSRDDAQKTANTLKRKEGISTYVTLR